MTDMKPLNVSWSFKGSIVHRIERGKPDYSNTNSLYGGGYRNTRGGGCLIFEWNKWRYGAPSLYQVQKALIYTCLDFYRDGLRCSTVIR